MTNADQLAKEIRLALFHHGYLHMNGCESDVERIIASKLSPLVKDAERYKKLMEINNRLGRIIEDD